MNMRWLCTLEIEQNPCLYYDIEENLCKNPNKGCSFREELSYQKEEPKRKEKWFEKYYK